MIADLGESFFNIYNFLEKFGREIDFDEFLDAITSKLGDKETKVILTESIIIYRKELTKFLIYLMMTALGK